MSAAFHVLNLAALFFYTRVWRHRYAEEPVIRPRLRQIVRDIGVLGSLACVSAALIGFLSGADGFGIINLISQWIFGELLLLLTGATYWLRRGAASVVHARV